MSGREGITELLRAHEAGARDALDRVVPLVYEELRRLARRHLRRGPRGYSLDTTGLVHEAYLKLAASEGLELRDQHHLMAVTARVMRQVLVDRARARLRQKRGSGQAAEEIDEGRLPGASASAEWLLDVGVDLASFFVVTPLPGTEDHDRAMRDGTIADWDFNQYDSQHMVSQHPRMSAEQVMRAYREAYRTFYSVKNTLRALLTGYRVPGLTALARSSRLTTKARPKAARAASGSGRSSSSTPPPGRAYSNGAAAPIRTMAICSARGHRPYTTCRSI